MVLKSKSSKRGSKYALDSFSEFLNKFHQISPDESIESFKDHQVAFDTLQAWINWFSTTEKTVVSKKKGDWKYIPTATTTFQYFHAIIRYLHYMGIKFHPYDIKQEITLPKPLQEDKHGIRTDEIKLILDNCSFEKKALYLAQLSSGMRIGELVQIRKKHLDFDHERIMIRIPAEFTKMRKARVTFFSKEFGKLFRSRLNKLDDNDLLFGTNEDWEKARDNEMQNMINLLERIGLKDITTHSFRAYVITQLSRKDPNFAKLLTGQKGYLLQYDRMNESDKLENYLKYEPVLLIYESPIKEKELKTLKKRVADLEEHKKESNAFWVDVNKMDDKYPDFMNEFVDKLKEFRENKKKQN